MSLNSRVPFMSVDTMFKLYRVKTNGSVKMNYVKFIFRVNKKKNLSSIILKMSLYISVIPIIGYDIKNKIA